MQSSTADSPIRLSAFHLLVLWIPIHSMPTAVNYIILAIPVFFLLIGVELLIDNMKHTGYYRLNDAISNLHAGMAEQVTGVFAKAVVVGVYIWLYESARLFTAPDNWMTWILLFLGIDFFYYWFHRLAHEVNILWGGHVVHHQSEEYNLSVALRQGAFQKFGSFIFYLPLALLGFHPVMFLVIGQFQTIYQFWIHTRLIGKMHPALEWVLNTPSHHRVHHGRNPVYIDKNHGGTLIIWDRMFGTFQAEQEQVVYGITTPLQTWNPLRAQLDVWRDMWRSVMQAKGIRHKLAILFMPPGWFPTELGGPQLPKEVDPLTNEKYDVRTPKTLNGYVLVQFLLILGTTSLFLFSYEGLHISIQIAAATLLIYAITCTGLLLELHRSAFYLELLRLLLTVSMAWWFIQHGILPTWVLAVTIFWLLVSIYWLWPIRMYFQKQRV
jgi:alkylglycerol monooxygenase